jgi:hypothetical protein
VGALELAKEPRRDERDLVARLELALELDLAALGDRNSDSATIATRNGAENHRIGFRSAVSDCPEVIHTIISLSRYQRDSVSSTVRNSATASSTFR